MLPAEKSNQQASSGVNPICTKIIMDLERCANWCNSGWDVMEVTKHFMTGFKTSVTRWNPYMLPELGQEPMAGQGAGSRRDPTIVLLSWQLLLSWIVFTEYGFSQPLPEKLLVATDDGQHRDPQLTEVERVRNCAMSSLKWNIYSTLPPSKAPEPLRERRHKEYKSQRCWPTTRPWMSSRSSRVAAHSRHDSRHKSRVRLKPDKPQHEEGSWAWS